MASTRPRHQLGFARVGRRDRDHLGILEVTLHEDLDIAAERHGGLDALLVDVVPGLDLAALARHGVDVGDQVGLGEFDRLGALQSGADAEHADLALVGLQVGDESGEARLDDLELRVELLGQLLGEIGVDALDLAGLGVAERYRVVERELAHAQLLALGHLEEPRLRLLRARRPPTPARGGARPERTPPRLYSVIRMIGLLL